MYKGERRIELWVIGIIYLSINHNRGSGSIEPSSHANTFQNKRKYHLLGERSLLESKMESLLFLGIKQHQQDQTLTDTTMLNLRTCA